MEKAIQIKEYNALPSIADFYAGKSVFITGGTGFLGKVFIEKLLYACTGIDKIYALVRDKKDLNAKLRIDNLIDQPLFSRLKNERPEDLNKLIPIPGDITEPELGIKPEHRAILIEKVSIVIHSAATITFDEPLNSTLKSNVYGTQQVLKLCKHLKNIKALVHISTAYSNPDKRVISEIIYPPPADLKAAYRFSEARHFDNIDPDGMTQLLKGHPNFYTFTKALSEWFLYENHGNIPTIIIRPSIVSACYHEPIKGWLDNWNGATGLVTAVGKGLNRVVFGRGDNVLDLVPVDYVSNLTIAAAAMCSRSEKVNVFNCCTSCANPLTCRELSNEVIKYSVANGFNDLPYPTLYFTQSKWVLSVVTFLLQTLPAILADFYLRRKGKIAKFLKIQSQVIKVRALLEFFLSQSWEMQSENTLALFASLSPSDQELFPFDLTDIVWRPYISIYMSGISRFLLKK